MDISARSGARRPPGHVAIVGAGVGGIRTAQHLRADGFTGRISVIGAELHPPYDRPPLSKQLLNGSWERDKLALMDTESLAALDLDLHLGRRAVRLHPGSEVQLSDGDSVRADAVVLAVGVQARRLPGQPTEVLTLRTLDDALALRSALLTASSVLVVGAGFVGAEVASTAMNMGVRTTVLEALPVPLSRVLGPAVGELCARLMRDAGVDLRTGALLAGFGSIDGRPTVEIAGGESLTADVAVVGIGGRPEVDWLADTGIDLSDGVPCDAVGRVTGLLATWALGDAASWADAAGSRARHEHWTSATEQAGIVARDVLGLPLSLRGSPYFWSDQFGLKIQLVGHTSAAAEVVSLHGAGLGGGAVRGTVIGFVEGGRLTAVVGFGAARFISRYRALLSGHPDMARVQELRASLGGI